MKLQIIFKRGWACFPWGPYEIDIDRSELRPKGFAPIRVYTTLIRSFEAGVRPAPA